MKSKQLLKWAAALIIPAAVLAGCSDTEKTKNNSHEQHSNIDHSNMGHGTNTGKDVDSVTTTDVLTGTKFMLTAKEGSLELQPGKIVPVWTFNNSMPGPQIRVKQGDRISVQLKNELQEPVSIHWHGYPVPNNMDGIPGVTQNAVQPGEIFTYEFNATVPGTYWYHSHQDSVNQLDRGLYGSLIVEGKEETPVRDYTLIMDEWMSSGMAGMAGMNHGNMQSKSADTKVDAHSGHGQAAHGTENKQNDPHGTAIQVHDMSMYDVYTLNGKTGQNIEKLTVKQGERVRLRLINAGYMSHSYHLHGHEFKITSTDGQPIHNPPLIKDKLISVAPGERYDIEFVANNPGVWYMEEHGDQAPMKGMKAVIVYEGAIGNDTPNDKERLPLVSLSSYGEKTKSSFSLDQTFDLDYTLNLGTSQKDGAQIFTINGKTYPNTDMLQVKKGDKVKVRLVNTSKSDDHPMHLHGHFFQVLSKDGQPLQGSPMIKDTLNVKPGEEYVVAFEADNEGDWMFHCHDLHHASTGMVTHLKYEGFKPQFTIDPKAGNKPE